MIKYQDYKIYAISSDGKWYGDVYSPENKFLGSTSPQDTRGEAIAFAKAIVDKIKEPYGLVGGQ